MKIGFIVTDLSNTRIGGISRVATEVGANLVGLGHEVVCYVLARPDQGRPAEYRGIQLRYIDNFPSLNPDYPVMGFSRRAFQRFCREAAHEHFDVLQSFNLNGIAAPRYAGQLKRLKIPFIMASFETILMDVKAKGSEFMSLPTVKTLLQILFETYLALFHEKRYLGVADRVLTEDENTSGTLRKMGLDPGVICLAPSGVDVEQAVQARAPGLDVRQGKKGPVIGYIGRVDPRKGVQYLVAAMARIRQRFPEVVLFLAGGSRHGYEQQVRDLIARHGLADSIRVLGRIEGDILPYYKLADLVVIPSLSEGIPITLGEAMAAKVPVVISRLPGVVPFVKPADLVHWAEIADAADLARAILAALEDPAGPERTERAYQFIRQYTWRSVAERYLAIYREAMASY